MKQLSKEEKRELLFKMQEHPENYSEQQFKELLEDEDIKILIKEMAYVKQAIKSSKNTCANIDEEWQKFSREHLEGIPKASRRESETEKAATRQRKNWTKMAASFIGIILISGVGLAAVIGLNIINNPFATKKAVVSEQKENITTNNVSEKPIEKTDSINQKPVTFNEAELQTILKEMGDFYNKEVVFKNKDVRRIRLYFVWNKQLSLEQNTELLNAFERINIIISENQIIVE